MGWRYKQTASPGYHHQRGKRPESPQETPDDRHEQALTSLGGWDRLPRITAVPCTAHACLPQWATKRWQEVEERRPAQLKGAATRSGALSIAVPACHLSPEEQRAFDELGRHWGRPAT